MSLLEELKRRNVFRVAIAYVVLAWLMAQVAELLLQTFGAPDWVLKSLLAFFLIGFPFAVFFAWAFELTPEGIKKEKDVDRSQSITAHTGRKLDYAIITILALALGYFAWDKFGNRPAQQAGTAPAAKVETEGQPASQGLPTDKSIAVLPFENRSRQEDDEYFTAGIHDDLLTQLAQIASLRVISRTSVEQFKGTTLSVREIAQKLNVATVLEGGVQRAGNQVRINLQLIDAATDTHMWAQTYDRELSTSNIFAIQSEIAAAVTDALRATLSPQEKDRIATVPTENMAALEEYFKGRAELDQRTRPAVESARMRLEHARTLDPEFALALAGEAEAIMLLADDPTSYGDIPVAEVVRLARPLAERALKLAPRDPQVLAVNGLLARTDFDDTKALDFYQQSLDVNPSSGEVLNWKRLSLFGLGRYKEALALSTRMVEVDPMSMVALYNSIYDQATMSGGDMAGLESMLQRLSGLNVSYGFYGRGVVEELKGNMAPAASYYIQSLQADPGRSSTRQSLGRLLFQLGLEQEGRAVAPDTGVDASIWLGQWDDAVRLARSNLIEKPADPATIGKLMTALMLAGDEDAAFVQAQALWARFGGNPFALLAIGEIYGLVENMAWVAHQTEHPLEAQWYRDAEATIVQTLKQSGQKDAYGSLIEARLAALDGRDSDAVAALSRAIDRGARWQLIDELPEFAALKGNPAFQVQISRMRDLVDQERREILAMLCGPDSILSQWTPAPGTCALYESLAGT